MNKQDLIIIRDAEQRDKNFILATFLRALYYGETWFTLIPKNAFMENYHKIVTALISTNMVKIACLREDPSIIIGYSVYNPSVLHWVYVKKSWRNIGVAKDLVPSHLETVTHITKVGLSIIQRKHWTFNPFKI